MGLTARLGQGPARGQTERVIGQVMEWDITGTTHTRVPPHPAHLQLSVNYPFISGRASEAWWQFRLESLDLLAVGSMWKSWVAVSSERPKNRK